MKKIKENIYPLLLMLSIPVMNIFYIIVNHLNIPVHNLSTSIDRGIPFIKIFIIPYISWYIFVPLVLFSLCAYDKPKYYQTIIIYNIGFFISCIIFALYQTTSPRPDIVGNDILSRIVSIIYSNDKPLNCFPSIHVFTSYLMIRSVGSSKIGIWRNKIITSVISILIILSTLFTKQHVFIDAVGGIALAEILLLIINKNVSETISRWAGNVLVSVNLKRNIELE